jgi:anthranilate synthase/phosphoribosyltransferase
MLHLAPILNNILDMKAPTVLMLDNFDSFTYNLVDFFRQLGCEVVVYRNTVEPEALAQVEFDLLVLSPGPSVPRNAGNMMRIIERFYQEKPILGVCLGHQALIEFFGGTLANIAPVHGKAVSIEHDGRGIFTGLEPGCEVARYHSWAGDTIPPEFEVSARSSDGVVMAVRHKRLPIEGIQFHPESVLSMKNQAGMRMLRNVVEGRMASGNRIYYELSQTLQTGAPIHPEALRSFLRALEEGQLSDDQKQILLVSLSHRLRNAQELANFIGVLMEFSSTNPQIPNSTNPQITKSPNNQLNNSHLVDICGTGGSGLPRINTSTLASMLLAHCGLKIVKHGNRAAAGRFGSFNLLESLGIPAHFNPEQAAQTLADTNLAFVFAPDVHPIFRHFASMRAKMGVPTIFNALGPLVNPYLPECQFVGTAFADLMDVIFETGIKMGKRHFIVVRGWDGLDEISLSAPTRVLEYRDGKKQDYELSPEDFGLPPLPFSDLSAASHVECLSIARDMLSGNPGSEHYKLVAINAAFVYTKFIEEIPLPDAYRKMEKLILEGAMGAVLEKYLSIVSINQAV